MKKVFTSKEFINKLKWLVYDVPNYYHSESDTWCRYNWSNNKFMMDCVVSIKGLLWGFNANKNAPHGGGVYLANGVADFTPDSGLDYCSDVSTNFEHLVPGEFLSMKSTGHSHAGVYIGNGKVFECTVAWGVNRCVISDIDKNGNRSYNGVRSLRWTYHGKLGYIDYSDADESTPVASDKKVNVYYQVETKEDGVLPMVKNLEDYAGWKNHAIRYLAIKADKGSVKYRVTTVNGKTLPWITKCDIKDHKNGCAGNGEPIATVEAYYYTPESIVKESGYKYIYYKINDYPYQKDTIKGQGFDGYAGVKGVTATKFQAYIDN